MFVKIPNTDGHFSPSSSINFDGDRFSVEGILVSTTLKISIKCVMTGFYNGLELSPSLQELVDNSERLTFYSPQYHIVVMDGVFRVSPKQTDFVVVVGDLSEYTEDELQRYGEIFHIPYVFVQKSVEALVDDVVSIWERVENLESRGDVKTITICCSVPVITLLLYDFYLDELSSNEDRWRFITKYEGVIYEL